jgi:siroheme synthase (precorrin-2 oxidase/ferrochelatase)
MQYFPINIRCADANIVVIGGDADAVAKIRLLLKTDAHITVFAEPLDTAGITDIFMDDHGRPVEKASMLNKNLALIDLDYLDDFLGGSDAISYIIVPELV